MLEIFIPVLDLELPFSGIKTPLEFIFNDWPFAKSLDHTELTIKINMPMPVDRYKTPMGTELVFYAPDNAFVPSRINNLRSIIPIAIQDSKLSLDCGIKYYALGSYYCWQTPDNSKMHTFTHFYLLDWITDEFEKYIRLTGKIIPQSPKISEPKDKKPEEDNIDIGAIVISKAEVSQVETLPREPIPYIDEEPKLPQRLPEPQPVTEEKTDETEDADVEDFLHG